MMINTKELIEQMENKITKSLQPLTVVSFKESVQKGSWILDTRPSSVFTESFVPGSISIGLDGTISDWAAAFIPLDQPIVLITEFGKEQESFTQLASVGIVKIEGYLDGGFETWAKEGQKIDMIIDIEPDELAMDIPHDNKLEILDVRKPEEFDAGHIKGAVNLPLDAMKDMLTIAQIDDENNLYIHCAGGYRSVIAASLIKRQGFHNIRNIVGGFNEICKMKNIPLAYPKK